ncbi:MAG: hypothetical protein A2474_01285 [Elusimicrobia bacterium RIFOXYC2_FULL_34_12]|nr:MAG: hypothetical protein A2474_01285 [Elusimicrobia bacterium RIFOXYC2_FULL_34_12]
MKILVSFIFAIAMGFLEAAVVVYLRELYYPNGFKISEKVKFPFIKFGPVAELKPFSKKLIITELGREFATIIMLVTFAILVGDELISKIAYFLLAFGIWDLFYYIFLKMLINWPESFGTTDVFFLIPVPWIGPVGLPITCSIVIIIIGLIILI